MECQFCHAPNAPAHRFCEQCGRALTFKCAVCGFDCAAAARFCGGCGIALGRENGASPGAHATAAAESVDGWGELKQATVLFADIVSSTEQIAQLDPEEAMDRLKPAVLLMCEAVERFGGTVMRTLGDGVMAVFGVPKALEGHARLACEAALHMQAAFSADAQGLSIRVGLHSGLVASDPHARDSGKGGGAHGVTIHLASRVVALAEPRQITLTSHCYALIRAVAQVHPIGTHTLKGIPAPVEIFRLAALSQEPHSQRFERAKLTPLRGREREMALMRDALARAAAGRGNVVGVTGAPGAGKSRLCFEFGEAARLDGVPVFDVHAQLYGHATPLQPVLELLRNFLFQLPSDADLPSLQSSVRGTLDRAGVADEAQAAVVLEFLGLRDPQAPAIRLDPKVRRAQLLRIVAELFAQRASTHAALVIEDLHWLDEASEEFISLLVKAVAGTRVLMVLNYRAPYSPRFSEMPHFQKVELGELSAGDTTAMVRELVSSRRELSELYELIAQRSGGNPFFAEELVQSLVESGILAAEQGAPRRTEGAIDSALPSTVQAVVAARIDRLNESDKGLLQTCAIMGKEFPMEVLVHVTNWPADDLRAVLERLYQAQLIQPTDGGRHYAFRHPLIQEVAYATQLKARRVSVHTAVASVMIGFYADRLDEYAGLVAHHYAAAGDNARAATYEARAAQWVGAVDAARAIKHWQRVRALLEEESTEPEHGRLKLVANGKISWLGWREGLTLEQVKPFLDEAMGLAHRFDAQWMQLLLMVEGRILQASGSSADLYVERVELALASLDAAAQPGRAVTLNAALSQAYGWAGLLHQALAANDKAVADIARLDKFDVDFIGFNIEHWLFAMRARLLTRVGRFDEARKCLDRLLDESAFSVDPVINHMPHYSYVELAAHTGDLALAQDHLAYVQDIAARHPSPYLSVFVMHAQALVRSMNNDHAGAAKCLGAAISLVRNGKVALEFETEILAHLAESHLGCGNLELALGVAQEAIRLSVERGNRVPQSRALMTWAQVVSADTRQGAAEEAAALVGKAQALARQSGVQVYRRHPPGRTATVSAKLEPAA
jgi:class 3 adenylate cyclase/tetratricopeptide (TPR) repeat protein